MKIIFLSLVAAGSVQASIYNCTFKMGENIQTVKVQNSNTRLRVADVEAEVYFYNAGEERMGLSISNLKTKISSNAVGRVGDAFLGTMLVDGKNESQFYCGLK